MTFRKTHGALCLALALLAVGTALTLSRAGSAFRMAAAMLPERTVFVIDAGHGGEDGGAVSPTGTHESELNLAIALRLSSMLRFLGMQTCMIRTMDCSVSTEGETIAQRKVSDLRNRVRLVEDTPNAVLVSIHQNLFSQTQYRGAQVFYNPAGQALAQQLQAALRACVDPNNHRAVKPAKDIYLMEHISCPGVLVECGFLSNAQEEQLLLSPNYQKKLAATLAATLINCLEADDEI